MYEEHTSETGTSLFIFFDLIYLEPSQSGPWTWCHTNTYILIKRGIQQNTHAWARNMYEEHTFETEIIFAVYLMHLSFPLYVSLCIWIVIIYCISIVFYYFVLICLFIISFLIDLVSIYECIYMHTYNDIYIYIYIHIDVYKYMYTYAYIHIYIYIYIYI